MRLLSSAPVPTTATLVLALAVTSLAACSAPESDTPTVRPSATSTPAAPTTAPTPEPSPEPTQAPTEVGEPRADLTPEGTELAATDEAVLQNNAGFDPAGEHYTEAQFLSRITEVVPAAVEDLTAADGSNPVDGATQDVFYVWSEHSLVWAKGNAPLGLIQLPSVYAWATDGSPASWIFGVGKTQCTGEAIREAAVGAVGTACTAVVVPKGQGVSAVGVLGNPDVSRDVHAEVTSTPVYWTIGG